MYTVILRKSLQGVERYQMTFHSFTDFVKAVKFAIQHREMFIRLVFCDGYDSFDIYNTINKDSTGGYELTLTCEFIG